MQARALSLQSQLVHTTAELESIRTELQESQARALLLEKVASLNKQHGAAPADEVSSHASKGCTCNIVSFICLIFKAVMLQSTSAFLQASMVAGHPG